MDTVIREGYVKKGKVLGKTMKKKYLVLRCASEMSMTAQLEVYDDAKQVRKKSTPNSVVSMKLVTGVKRIEAPIASGATLREGGNFIRLDIQTDRVGVEELYLSLDIREVFEDWLTDLEFLVRLPDLIIPLSFVPKRELPLTQQTTINKAIFGEIEFEDACPVETLQTELGIKWQFNNRFFILVLTRTTLAFLDPHTGLHALTYNINCLRRCGNWQKLVFIESGRRTDTGPGYLWLYVHSKVLAKNFYSTLSNVMGSVHHMLVTQRYLCWDKFREELPPASVDSICDDTSGYRGPVVDNEIYVIESLEYNLSADNPSRPPLPPNHPSLQPGPVKKYSCHTSTRQEDTQLPPTPLDPDRRRASLPGHNRGATLNSRTDTFSGIPPIKTRYDMLVPGDTQELQFKNGQVETKMHFANTDGKGNVVTEGSKKDMHSYYDVNELVSQLTGVKSSPPTKKKHSLKNDPNKFNTISVVKLSKTASKETIGRSTFYKSSLPIGNTDKILPYAEFSDLATQVPLEVRRERLRKLSITKNNTLDNHTGFSFQHSYHPETPIVLYSTPLNIPVEEHYKLVDPKPRPVRSSSSLPEQLNVTDVSLYDTPVDLDYQHPFNNAEVVFPPTQTEVPRNVLEKTGDYDRLISDTDIKFEIENSRTTTKENESYSPLYEKMTGRRVSTPEAVKDTQTIQETDDVMFTFTMQDTEQVNPWGAEINNVDEGFLCNLDEGIVLKSRNESFDNAQTAETVESDVAKNLPDNSSSPETIDVIQKTSCAINDKETIELDKQVYETMVNVSAKKSSIIIPSHNRYQNIPQLRKPSPLTPKPMLRRETSPFISNKQKPVLDKTAKSFAFSPNSPSDPNCIYYAELDLKTEDTIFVNEIHCTSPATQYDKIDHKLSNILQETVRTHREPKY